MQEPDSMQVRCAKCNAMMRGEKLGIARSRAKGEARGGESSPHSVPQTIKVFSKEGVLRIEYKVAVDRSSVLLFVLMSLFLVQTLVPLFLGEGKGAGQPLLTHLAWALGDGLGAFVAWCFSLALWANRTTILVKDGLLAVGDEPIRITGDKKVPVGSIQQVHAEPAARLWGAKQGDRSYTLYAATSNGDEVKLMKDGLRPEEALFLAHRINAFLGIADQSVAGEIAG